MDNTSRQLADRCEGIVAGGGEAIQWIQEVRGNSHRLDRESASLIDKLRRVRNLARRLGRASQHPVSVGFFGLSQAGKSYLISALAAGENGELETLLDGEPLNFISHVNPPGHGKEATGLVTRFTRHGSPTPPGFPIELSLFSEVDLVKVLGNAFFNDFDREQVEFNTDPGYIRTRLAGLEAKRRPQPTGGVSEDDVIDLRDYFERRFRKSMEPLMGDYWPTAVELAPCLEPPDRAALFSILWGEIGDLSETYLNLRTALSALGHAETVYCPTSALVVRADDGKWTQANSIMNVDILERLGKDNQDRIEAVPMQEGQPGAPVRLPRSLLAALTAEMRFVLAETPVARVLEQVDLLDFPGYRGRLAVSNLEEVRKQLKDDQVDPVAQLVLRGKVAYLFERYTDDQEMNALVLCTPCHKQMDVHSLGPVIEDWIHSTQGDIAAVRDKRLPGLIWAITMFDFRLAPAPGETVDTMRIAWDGMMKMTLLERFGQYGWVHEWSPGRPFDNLFLVRKPRMATSVIETREGVELGILPNQEARLAQMRETFLENESVRKHIKTAELAWEAMLAFNDGGIDRLAQYLESTARLEIKLERIREQLDAIVQEVAEHRLGNYYHREGAAEVENKKRLTERVVAALRRRPDRFGELLSALYPSSEHLRALYLRAEDASRTPEETETRFDDGGAGLIDLNFDALAPVTGSATRFVQATMRDWIAQLKELPGQPDMIHFLDLPKEILEDLIDELITGADRLKLEEDLLFAIQDAEERTSATRSRLVERQVFAVRTPTCEFVDRLGIGKLPLTERPPSPIANDRLLFQPPPAIDARALPELTPRPVNFSAMYIVDWFEAFAGLAVDNAGHYAGREITPEQNQALGEILAVISGTSASTSN